jgi:folate-binding protein YgfZ
VSVSSLTLDEQYRALRTGRGAYRLPRDVLSVAGADAATYLQGQCSQDLAVLEVGRAADSLLLAPEGKVVALIRVLRSAEHSYVIDVDGGFGEAVLARLRRFLLRSKVEIEALEWECIALRGHLEAGDLDGGDLDGDVGGGVFGLPVDWNGWRGVDLLGPAGAITIPDEAQWCGDDAWEACRIESGLPVMGRELDEGTIPAESGLVERTVSFTKGCYTGQELVARIDSRGSRVAHRLCGLVLDTSVEPAGVIGAELALTGAERPVGRVTSAAHCPGLGAVGALAYVHRSVEVPAAVTVAVDGGIGAQVRVLPLI